TCTWSSGPLTCTVSGLTNGTPYTFMVTAANTVTGPASSPSPPVTPGSGTFHSVTPCRVLDTRPGIMTGGLSTFTPNQNQQFPFTSGTAAACGVPATHVSAVLMNVTVTNPSQIGWLTLYPGDANLPTASNLNFVAGQTVPNLVAVKLGASGPNAGKVAI